MHKIHKLFFPPACSSSSFLKHLSAAPLPITACHLAFIKGNTSALVARTPTAKCVRCCWLVWLVAGPGCLPLGLASLTLSGQFEEFFSGVNACLSRNHPSRENGFRCFSAGPSEVPKRLSSGQEVEVRCSQPFRWGRWVDKGSRLDSQGLGWLSSQGSKTAWGSCPGARLRQSGEGSEPFRGK